MFLHFLFPLWIHFLFFLASRHEWRCTQKGKKIFLLSSILQALTTPIGSQKLASLTLPGQISILNRFFSSQSKAAVLKETSISLGIMEAVLKMQVGSPQLPQIVTGRENIRNQPHCTVNWRPILPSNAQVREIWRKLVTVNLPLENIHFEIPGDPCNLSGSHRCSWFTKHTIFTLNQSHLFHNQWERFA